MQALILVGGLGTRLRPAVGTALPKPMAPVAGRPFLAYLLGQLRREGFREAWLLTGHRGEAVEAYFGTGDGWDLTVRYSHEPEPLGTGGALRHALSRLDGERFLVMNGDSFLGAPLAPLARAHRDARATARAPDAGVQATLALTSVPDGRRFGSVARASGGRVTGFREKASQPGPAVEPALVNAGIYVVERAILETLPPAGAASLERDLFPTLLDGRLRGLELAGPFVDIGLPESYAALCADPSPLLALLGAD